MDYISKRRSIRRYQKKEVHLNLISQLLEVGNEAALAGNIEHIRFIVVREDKKKKEIAKACLNQYWSEEASALIVICSDIEKLKEYYHDKARLFEIQNCAAVAENMLIKATLLKLGSCWISIFDEKAIKRVLKIPTEISAEIVIAIGYSDEKPEKRRRIKTNEITYFEEYNKKEADYKLFPLKKSKKEKS